jgi:hypothetical protein
VETILKANGLANPLTDKAVAHELAKRIHQTVPTEDVPHLRDFAERFDPASMVCL